MQRQENHVPNADTSGARAGEPQQNSTGLRSWVLTISIAGTVLATMYGLAYWNEARSEAVRAQTISAPVAGQ